MDSGDFQRRFEQAHKLLTQETTNREKFEGVRTLIKGYNPKVDSALEKVSGALSDLEKLKEGEIIELSAQHLPENSEEEKERKKKLLAFIRYWKDLTSEVERVRNELSSQNNQSPSQQVSAFGKIVKLAKGPFGAVTIAAVAIVAVLGFINFQKPPETVQNQAIDESPKQKIQVIVVDDKKIPLSEVRSATGSECEGKAHYHARENGVAVAIDGTQVVDPNPTSCGYGKVEEVKIEEIEQP
ncbi:MAG: hypothetical protein HYW63_00805 [Candidatus Levybacteria bacterium]|nr:hypothetical protein [Candidatus Levybacteria bacterium]